MHSPPTDAPTGTWRQLLSGRYLGTATVLAGGVALYATNVYLTTSLLPTAIDDIGGQQYYAWTATVFLIASVISSMLVTNVLAARGPRGAYLIGSRSSRSAPLSVRSARRWNCCWSAARSRVRAVACWPVSVTPSSMPRSPRHLWTRGGAALVSAMWGGVGTFAGPAIGGVFAQFGAWRWAFGVLAIATIAVAALVPQRATGT